MNWKTICQILIFSLISSEIFSQFSENRTHLICEPNPSSGSINKADVDNDGFEDIIIQENRGLLFCKNEGNGQFTNYLITDEQAWDEVLHDIDLDGDIDILFFCPNNEELAWLENDGKGNFSEPSVIEGSKGQNTSYLYQFFPTDFDGDNDLDILFRVGVSAYKWLVNDGKGNFSLSTNALILEGIDYIDAIDIDNNGKINLVVFSPFSGQNKIVYYALDNRGNLLGSRDITNSFLPTGDSYDLFDIDNDGDIDVITGNGWYKNDGVGIFAFQENIFEELGESCMDVEWVDIDNDYDLDAVLITSCGVSTGWDRDFGWLENDGKGNFSDFKIIHDFFFIKASITTLDVENDGDLDIVISVNSNAVEKIIWYENLINLPPIVAIPFWDENENGLFESSELPIKNISLQASPAPLSIFSNSNGGVSFFLEEGVYDLSLEANTCWEPIFENILSNIEYNGTTDTMYLGLRLISENQNSSVIINSNPTRCGFNVSYNISLENDGCAPINGKFGLVLDNRTSLINTEIAPNETRGDTLLWDFTDFNIEETNKIGLVLQMPGPEFIGQWLKITGLSYVEDAQGILALSDTYEYNSEIRCAYDPNDKLVSPNRLADYDQNYTLFDESLAYPIRFQNTGNDTAFTVVIRDTLDKNLDWTSLKPILGSHSFETHLYKDGLVEFTFKDILLPDSTTNEPASHGFVSYKILTNEDLSENTVIENTAGIYFDFNPPIITNTTKNVLVSTLPKTTSINDFYLRQTVKVYPNPFDDFLTVEQTALSMNDLLILVVFDVTGRQIQHTILEKEVQQIYTDHLAAGLYFYQISSGDGQLFASGKVVKQ